MTAQNLRTLRSRLDARARELARSLRKREIIEVERSADSLDDTLRATERESSAQTLARDSRLLRDIEAARARIRDGAFGTCLGCEEPIAPKRLQAVPWAAYCVSCQERTEQGGPLQPRPDLAAEVSA